MRLQPGHRSRTSAAALPARLLLLLVLALGLGTISIAKLRAGTAAVTIRQQERELGLRQLPAAEEEPNDQQVGWVRPQHRQ